MPHGDTFSSRTNHDQILPWSLESRRGQLNDLSMLRGVRKKLTPKTVMLNQILAFFAPASFSLTVIQDVK